MNQLDEIENVARQEDTYSNILEYDIFSELALVCTCRSWWNWPCNISPSHPTILWPEVVSQCNSVDCLIVTYFFHMFCFFKPNFKILILTAWEQYQAQHNQHMNQLLPKKVKSISTNEGCCMDSIYLILVIEIESTYYYQEVYYLRLVVK